MWGQEDREAGLDIPLAGEGAWRSHSHSLGLSYSLQRGKRASAQEGKQVSSEGKTKQSQELGELQMATDSSAVRGTPIPGEAGRVTVLKGLPAFLPPSYRHQLNVCYSLSSV